MLDARDAWQNQEPERLVRSSAFSAFRDWATAAYQSTDTDAIAAVTALFDMVLGANAANYDVDTLREKLNANVHKRTYRFTYACDGMHSNFRVRHFFLAYLDMRTHIAVHSFLCHPWIAGPHDRTVRSGGELTHFPTVPFTPFERILTLHLLCQLHERLQSFRPPKRSTQPSSHASDTTTSSHNGIPVHLRTISMKTLHRFSYAVQKVVACWSRFLQYYGNEGVEQFIRPYINYNPNTVTMTVIQSREEGFPVDVDVTAQEWPMPGELTTIQQPTCTAAFHLDAKTDNINRKTAQAFMDHCFSVVTSATLYRVGKAENWGTGTSLASASRSRPASGLRTALPEDVKEHFASLEPAKSSAGASSSGSHKTAHAGAVQDTSSLATASFGKRAAAAAATATPSASNADAATSSTVTTTATQRHTTITAPPSTAEVTEAVQTVKSFVLGQYVHAYNSDFDELIESYDTLGNDRRDLGGRVQLVLTDPPFNVRRERGLPNSGYDKLSFNDMKRVVNRVTDVLRKGGHVIIMCTREQHHIWHRLFASATEDGYADTPEDQQQEENSEDPYSIMDELRDHPVTSLYGITADPLLFLNKPHHYQHGSRYSATHQNGVQYAFHAKRNGLPRAEEQAMVQWWPHNYVRTTYPVAKNILDNVPRLSPGESVRVVIEEAVSTEKDNSDSTGDGSGEERQTTRRSRALRPEQKPLLLLQELISRYSKSGDIVVDFFAGTFSTAVAAASLPEHRVFIGTELDKGCFDVAVDVMIRRIAVYLASNSNDIPIPRQVRPALQLLQRAHIRERSRDILWEAPERMPQYQMLPQPVVAAVVASAGRPLWLVEYVAQPVHRWPPAMQLALMGMDDDILLQADCANNGVIVMKSTVNHPNAGRGCFAARSFQEGELIGCYYGTLVYHNLFHRTRAPRKEYGHGVMTVNRMTFMTYAFRVLKSKNATGFSTVTDLTDGRSSIHIVPPPFCSMRYINDARYIQGDPDKQTFTDGGGRTANVLYAQSARDVKTPKDLERNDIIEVRAARQINPGEELFGDYGSGYLMFNTNEYHDGKL